MLLDRPDPGFDEDASLVHDLQPLFPGREIDLAILNHADPLLLRKATESYRLLYGAERDLQDLRLHAFKRYQDHRKYLELSKLEIFPAAFASQIARCAGLRNRLVTSTTRSTRVGSPRPVRP